MRTYASTTLGISVKYPQSYIINDSYTYDQFGPNKLIYGVKFTIPPRWPPAPTWARHLLMRRVAPHAHNCTGDIYVPDNVKATDVVDNGIIYSVATTTDAAAGNRYEEQCVVPSSKPCTAVRYFIHWGVIENYPAGAVTEFDHAALLASFDQIRRTLVVSLQS